MTVPVDNIVTALGLNTMEGRDYVLRAYEDVVGKYRALRGHVRKDGAIKLRLPREVAEREAVRLTEKFGRRYTAYPCPLCNGMYHTGCDRDHEANDTEDIGMAEPQTITITGHSDDIVNIEPAVGGLDEIGCYDKSPVLVIHAGEKAVRLTMRYKGVWSAEVAPLAEDHPMPDVVIHAADNGYSVAAVVPGVTSIVREAASDD